MVQKKFKQLKSVGLLLLIVFSAFSIIFFINHAQAASIPMHIIWERIIVTESYDSGRGEFRIQIKYNDGQNMRAQKSSTHRCYAGEYSPQITFDLNEEVLLGTLIYLRLIEDDVFQDDQIIRPYVENSGSGINNGNWYSYFYVGTTFEEYTFEIYNSRGDSIRVRFMNLEA